MEKISQALRPEDLWVIAGYFILVTLIGVYVTRQTKTGDDLFLAGRSLTWFAIGTSLFASNISSTTLIGLTGSAYADGISVSAYEWVAGIPLILLAFVFAPVYLRARISTVPEYLDVRFDRRVRLYFSAVTIVLTVLVDMAGGLYAASVVLRTFFPDISLTTFTTCIGLFAGIYTAAGGLRAVVYTDVLQAIVLIVGSLALTIIMFGHLDYSWANLLAVAPPEHFSLIRPIDDEQLPWTGLVTGVVLLGFWYWVTNQYITQRVLGAKNLQHAQWGAMFGGALKLLPLFIMVLPGAMALHLYPDIPNRDMVFPVMVTKALPVGLTGLVLAGLIAAIMSSVDSTLNASSALVVRDFMSKREKEISPEQSRRTGRITTITLMVIAIIWAPNIQHFSGLWSYLQQAFSIIVPPVAAVFLIGVFWKRATALGALLSLVFGHAIGIGVYLMAKFYDWPLHFTENVFVMTIFSMVVMVIVSLATPRPDPEKVERGVWRPELALPQQTRGGPMWSDPRWHALFVILGILATVLLFW